MIVMIQMHGEKNTKLIFNIIILLKKKCNYIFKSTWKCVIPVVYVKTGKGM